MSVEEAHLNIFYASVLELVDRPDSKSGAERRVGSSPTRGTNFKKQ